MHPINTGEIQQWFDSQKRRKTKEQGHSKTKRNYQDHSAFESRFMHFKNAQNTD